MSDFTHRPELVARGRIEFDAIGGILDEVEDHVRNTMVCATAHRVDAEHLKVTFDDGMRLDIFDGTKDDDVRIFVDTDVCGSVVRYGGSRDVVTAMAYRYMRDTITADNHGGIDVWREHDGWGKFHRLDWDHGGITGPTSILL